jgi:hypothetical protein
MILSATPSVEDVLELIDSGVSEFKNQKLCDSDKVTDVLLDIRNLVSLSFQERNLN